MALQGASRSGAGFSLVEILVALLLLAVALTTMTALYAGHHNAQIRAGQQVAAQGYLLDNMERLRAMAPLREGREVWVLEEQPIPLPPGIPTEGARLVLDVEPWEGAERGERILHVVLTLAWTTNGRPGRSRLESLMVGGEAAGR